MKKYLFLLLVFFSCWYTLQYSETIVYADNKASIMIIGDLNGHTEQIVSHDEVSDKKEEKTKLKEQKRLPKTGELNSLNSCVLGLILLASATILRLFRKKNRHNDI